MSEPNIDKVREIGAAAHDAIGAAVEKCRPASRDEIRCGLAAAIAMVVSYETAQAFIDELAVCVDAKEHIRAIDAGEVPAVN